jgi:hypothetical protein
LTKQPHHPRSLKEFLAAGGDPSTLGWWTCCSVPSIAEATVFGAAGAPRARGMAAAHREILRANPAAFRHERHHFTHDLYRAELIRKWCDQAANPKMV